MQLGLFDIADRVSPPQSNFVPLIRKNDPRVLDMIEAQMPPRRFWTFGFLAPMAGRIYLLDNQGPRLAKQYRAVASTPEQFVNVIGKDRLVLIAPLAALALRSAGDDAQARRLLALAETEATRWSRPSPDDMVMLARIHAVKGETDKAIGLLSAGVRAGWLPPFVPIPTDIAIDPPLNELRKDPRFEKLRQQILGHLAKERAELGPIRLD